VETSSLATSRSETASLSVLMSCLGDPVNSGIVSDGGVSWVNHNDLEPLVDGILSDPVGVQNSKRSALAAGSLLSN